jgi:hypothetical protein
MVVRQALEEQMANVGHPALAGILAAGQMLQRAAERGSCNNCGGAGDAETTPSPMLHVWLKNMRIKPCAVCVFELEALAHWDAAALVLLEEVQSNPTDEHGPGVTVLAGVHPLADPDNCGQLNPVWEEQARKNRLDAAGELDEAAAARARNWIELSDDTIAGLILERAKAEGASVQLMAQLAAEISFARKRKTEKPTCLRWTVVCKAFEAGWDARDVISFVAQPGRIH